ncbi:hypothetical protein Tco_0477549 [Tanacetum coccineum]
MVESLPTMVDTHIKEQVKKQVPEQVRDQVPVYVAEGLILERQKTKEEMERMIAKAILQELDASVRSYMSGHILHVHPVQSQIPSVPEQQYQLYLSMKNDTQLQQQDIAIWLALQMKFDNLQNSAKRQKTSEYEAYVSRESSSGQVNEEERDDDEIPTKQVSQDIMEEVSLTIDEAKLKKMADELLRQRFPRAQRELTNDEVEYLKLFEEEIEVRLKYRNQMRRWEMYVNEGPLGPRREHPE